MFGHAKLFWFCLLIVSYSSMLASESTPSCNLSATTAASSLRGGRYITARGNLNILCVYVQFPDDNYLPTSSNWPKGQAPSYLNTTVDSIWSSTPTPGSFTDYFNQMSFNQLKITGSSVSIITPHTRNWYLTNRHSRGFIIQETLHLLDSTVDFARFDNWRFNREYSVTDSSDGIVDMIFMMWRNVRSDTSFDASLLDLVPGGEASLGYWGSYFVDDSARTICTDFPLWGQGSGITVEHPTGGDLSRGIIMHYARHEFGHWLLGGNDFHTDLGMWGLVDGFGSVSGCMNSFERDKVGWIDLVPIDDISTSRTFPDSTLPDFATTGKAYKIKVPGGGADEYYLLENHQRLSAYDTPDQNHPSLTGLYVLLQKSDQGSDVGIVSAQGRFNWTVPLQDSNKWGPGNLPVFKRGMSNSADGYCVKQYIPWTWGGIYQGAVAIHYYLDPVTGVERQAPPTIFSGNGQDQFDLTNARVFSPYSNPSSDLHHNINKIGFDVKGINNGVYTLDLHFNNLLVDGFPSKPQDLVTSFNSANALDISWTQNQEPDLVGYNIYREIYYGGTIVSSFTQINTSLLVYPNYTDNTYTSSLAGIPSGTDVYARYRIEAVDNTGKISIKSDTAQSYLGRILYGTVAGLNLDGRTIVPSTLTVNSGSLTVNTGASLTICPGVIVRFAANTGLFVNGCLTAQGTSAQRVIFTSQAGTLPDSWWGLNFTGTGSAHSSLKYCTLQYGGYAIECHDTANITVDHCSIINNRNGVLCWSSSPVISNDSIANSVYHGINLILNCNPRIENNKIIRIGTRSNFGIYTTQSGAYLNSNTISGLLVGVYPTSNSSVAGWSGNTELGGYNYTPAQNNVITGNTYGLSVNTNSISFLGWTDENGVTRGGNNYIGNNFSYDLYPWDNTTTFAEKNWYGVDTSATVRPQGNWYIKWSPLTTNPWPGLYLRMGEHPETYPVSIDMTGSSSEQILTYQSHIIQDQEDQLFQEALSAQMKRSISEAKSKYKQLISSKKYARSSLVLLSRLSIESNDKDELYYFENLKSEPAKNSFNPGNVALATNLLANMKGYNRNYKEAFGLFDDVIKNYPNTEDERIARIQKIYYTMEGLKDILGARKLLNELLEVYKTGDDIDVAKELIDHALLSSEKSSGKLYKEAIIEDVPTEYALAQNYPNPFNPTTSISYAIPQSSLVTLKVYDILGREIETLVNEFKTQGRYTVSFDAGRLSSGVYVYRIQAGAFIAVRKLNVVK